MRIETSYISGVLCGGELIAYVPPGTVWRHLGTHAIPPERCDVYIVPDGTDVVWHNRGWQESQGGDVERWDDTYRTAAPDDYGRVIRTPCTVPEGYVRVGAPVVTGSY